MDSVPGDNGRMGGNGAPSEPLTPAERVVLPEAQLEDLNLVRNEWGKIVKTWAAQFGPASGIRWWNRRGDSCLCVVFTDQSNFIIGTVRRLWETSSGMWKSIIKNQFILRPDCGAEANASIPFTSVMKN